MTEGGFGSGATAVHERPTVGALEVNFVDDVRTHLRVLGLQGVLESISMAHQWFNSQSVVERFSPTQRLVADLARMHPDGWSAVLRLVADVIGEARLAQATSRA